MKEKMKKVLAFGIVGLTALSGVYALAGNDSKGNGLIEGADCMGRHSREGNGNHGAEMEAIRAGDYAAFSTIREIPLEEFSAMAAEFQAHEDAREAVEAGDYEAWALAVAQLPNGDKLVQVITAEDFAILKEIQQDGKPGLLMGLGKRGGRR